MTTLLWIVFFGLLVSCIALVGSLTLFFPQQKLNILVLPLVAFAAGSLIGGAIFHMIPSAVEKMSNETKVYVWLMGGFMLMYALEEFLSWHHSHTHRHPCGVRSPPHQHSPPPDCGLPMINENETIDSTVGISNSRDLQHDIRYTQECDVQGCESIQESNGAGRSTDDKDTRKFTLAWLIILADAVHNLIGGMFVGASFVDSTELGISAWIAAAAHEVPQELGDFAVLIHGGLSKRNALLLNFLSALTFPLGGIIAYSASKSIDISFLIPFAAGNFLYIGGSDLIPEVKHYHGLKRSVVHFLSFTLGVGILLTVRIAYKGW